MTDDLAVVTIDHRREVGPAVRPAVHVGDVGGPAFVAPRRLAAAPLDPGPWCRGSLMHKPAPKSADAIDGLRGQAGPLPKAQQRP